MSGRLPSCAWPHPDALTRRLAVAPASPDGRLQKLHKELGNKWADIGRRMSRSENQVRHDSAAAAATRRVTTCL